ncbi:hypothetical protein H0266_08495 [Halobacillus locisalis]|uniref:Siderophore synthetase component n=1 Tax=Halobacillus locisalis TaxID=220753 RepID=A0A838CSQ8_9BACI|nr:IucA/IucC family protein [Halobacillus locisalis]MBA2174928.1 hypothetical protein [Halobacillus locisalis]
MNEEGKLLIEFARNDDRYRKKAEKAVLHQLVQAIIRENIVPYEWTSDHMITIPAKEADVHVEITHRYTLGHIDIDSIQWKSEPVTTAGQLLDLLFQQQEQRLKTEIADSIDNYTLALAIAEKRQSDIHTDASDVFEYAKHPGIQSPLSFFEQWVIQGHTIHPCSRTRLGMTTEDVATYAPEWQGRPQVIPMAVKKGLFQKTGASPRQILFDEYPEVEHAFYERGLAPEEYELIPVHPWQLEHTIPKYYAHALHDGGLVALDRVGIDTAALISFRTLAPFNNQMKHHIKTAVNVQMTSAVRTVSAASTKNGPTLSRLLEGVFEDLSYPVSVMKESAGIHYEPAGDNDNRHFLQKNLAAILRENPERDLKQGEIAIPAAALMAESPVTNKLVMEDLIDHQKTTAEAFIKQYASILLPGILTLITKYGISMEAHLQNVVVIFEEAEPKRVILRDYGGIRIMNDRLNQFAQTEIDPSTNLPTDNPAELLHVFSHALLHNHLGEMIVALARKGSDESRLWQPVAEVVRETYRTLQKETPEVAVDEPLLFSETSTMKALVKMRMTNRFTENMYVTTANPLRTRNEVFEP